MATMPITTNEYTFIDNIYNQQIHNTYSMPTIIVQSLAVMDPDPKLLPKHGFEDRTSLLDLGERPIAIKVWQINMPS